MAKKTTASVDIMETGEPTGTCTKACKKIDKLTLVFGNEDMNKMVEKINEIIENKCQ